MKTFTSEELAQYDGRGGKVYVAFEGDVYDLSTSYHWRNGKHHVVHRGGCDLTGDISRAPHGASLLRKFPVVGRLIK